MYFSISRCSGLILTVAVFTHARTLVRSDDSAFLIDYGVHQAFAPTANSRYFAPAPPHGSSDLTLLPTFAPDPAQDVAEANPDSTLRPPEHTENSAPGPAPGLLLPPVSPLPAPIPIPPPANPAPSAMTEDEEEKKKKQAKELGKKKDMGLKRKGRKGTRNKAGRKARKGRKGTRNKVGRKGRRKSRRPGIRSTERQRRLIQRLKKQAEWLRKQAEGLRKQENSRLINTNKEKETGPNKVDQGTPGAQMKPSL